MLAFAEDYRVEEDVGRLEVPVDDLFLRRVQEGEAARRARGDLEPPAPRQRLQVSTPACSDRQASQTAGRSPSISNSAPCGIVCMTCNKSDDLLKLVKLGRRLDMHPKVKCDSRMQNSSLHCIIFFKLC